MDDIKRPVPPQQRPVPLVEPPPQVSFSQPQIQRPLTPPLPQVDQTPVLQPTAPQPIEATGPSLANKPKPKRGKKKWIILVSALFIIVGLVVGGWLWYQAMLKPVNSNDTEKQKIEIVSGTLPADIAKQLKDSDLIRNESVFLLYARLEGSQDLLQAGTYRLAPSESTPEIIEHLTKGNTDSFDITFLPGNTLADNKKAFLAAGYEEGEIDTAFKKTYDSPLFVGKPADADLEGYIYGDTYRFGTGASVEEILEFVFEFYHGKIAENNLEQSFTARGLSLYEGITLASIIQRESGGEDKAQIAQVFYTRLAMDMPLGSDVTYQYAADKLGVPRDTNLDSPYNTRIVVGLPPGPIATPGIDALKAVASPAAGEYVYFLSGDDDITYFAKTLAEHEANIANHCKVKCQII